MRDVSCDGFSLSGSSDAGARSVYYNGIQVGSIVPGWSRSGGYGWLFSLQGKGPSGSYSTVSAALAGLVYAFNRHRPPQKKPSS